MSEDLDRLIWAKEKELHPMCARMEELRLQFISDTAKFAANWYGETAKQYVTKYPEITLTLSKEKLFTMKTKVNNLTKNADKIVTAALSAPSIWWHMEPHKTNLFRCMNRLETSRLETGSLRQLTNP